MGHAKLLGAHDDTAATLPLACQTTTRAISTQSQIRDPCPQVASSGPLVTCRSFRTRVCWSNPCEQAA